MTSLKIKQIDIKIRVDNGWILIEVRKDYLNSFKDLGMLEFKM
jgi:hypothetical protein